MDSRFHWRWFVLFLGIALDANSSLRAEREPGLTNRKPSSGICVESDHGYMIPYRETIPGTQVSFEMVPIPGGTIRMQPLRGFSNSDSDSGVDVPLEPVWIGRCEVTWAEYDVFRELRKSFIRFDRLGIRQVKAANRGDAITAPSTVYVTRKPPTADKSEWPRHPAVSMTQFAARQYTKWLSKLTGRFFRLPSEAEWEHACRAGSNTSFHFGDDARHLSDYAWYFENSDEDTHPVGLKRPNGWGLYDMHGNACEWVLDQYSETYEPLTKAVAAGKTAIHWPTHVHPRTVRGGSWDSDARDCQSSSRIGSSKAWHNLDPQLPPSPVWLAIHRQVGFRIVRPLNSPTADSQGRYWDADVNELKEILKRYGTLQTGIVDPELPAAVEQLNGK